MSVCFARKIAQLMVERQTLAPFTGAGQNIPWWRTEIGDEEREAVAASLVAGRISQGPVTAELEVEICKSLNVEHAIVVTSGSVALLAACIALDLGRDDEVIVPTRTFIATAHAPYLLGATIVFADCLRDSPAVDPREIERKITPRTKAIIPVHLNGRGCDMAAIMEIARKHGIVVLEDAAQAMFSRHTDGTAMGVTSAAGCFSFGMVKIVSTGQGGVIVTNDKQMANRLRSIRNHGVRDIVSHQYLEFGLNFKFNDVLASIGLGQMHGAAAKVEHCNRIYRMYEAALRSHPAIRVVPVAVDRGEVAVWTEVVADNRDAVIEHLGRHGIQTRKFLPCLHTAPHLGSSDRFPNSERFARTGFNLPCGPAQPLENVELTIDVLARY